MKKRIFRLLAVAALVALQVSVYAQNLDLDPNARIPADTAVRTGRLPNGMTYYIRHNPKPAGQAEFFLARHVGAIDESDAQQGLAHFLEHMSFDGTRSFPGNNIIDYLETIGVKFGANLNAYTGMESTVFNISRVPLRRDGIVDSVLLILHDWSSQLTLDSAAIDKERGVIVEELRTRNTASRRLWEKGAPTLYNDSKYAQRNLIGYEDRLKTFPHSELSDFYHTWYRTDNQAVIVVGDFDPDAMREKVARTMSDVAAATNPTRREATPIPGNVEPLVTVLSDPEQQTSQITIYVKRDPIPFELRDRVAAERTGIIDQLIDAMAGYRLMEITQKQGAPFISATSGLGDLTETSQVFIMSATAREGEIDKALRALYAELERIIRYGFTQSELDMVRNDFISSQRQAFQNRNKRDNARFVDRYIDNFISGAPMPDAAYEWKLDSALVYPLQLDEVNRHVKEKITRENQVVVVYSPAKAGLAIPANADIERAIADVRASSITPYRDTEVQRPLIERMPRGSRIRRESADTVMATKIWTLRNGIRVVLMPTDYMADQILLAVSSYGGLSALSDDRFVSGRLLTSVVGNSGLGAFSSTELVRRLAGKNAVVSPEMNNFTNGLGGKCSVEDLETMFQLLYLRLTAPRFTQEDYRMTIDKQSTYLQNTRTNPNFIMQDSLSRTLYGNNMRRNVLDLDQLGKARFDQMAPVYRSLYGNPRDFTFILVGNIDEKTLRPLVEKYLGALRTRRPALTWRDDGARPVTGEVSNVFTAQMEMPKSTVAYVYTGTGIDYTLENIITMSALKQILDMRCTESIRQEKSGTYGVYVSGTISKLPAPRYTLAMSFDTNEAMADELSQLLHSQVLTLASADTRPEELAKVKEYMLKQHRADLQSNSTWLGLLAGWYVEKVDLLHGYNDIVDGLTSDKIKAMAAKIVADGNLCRVVMNPKNQ